MKLKSFFLLIILALMINAAAKADDENFSEYYDFSEKLAEVQDTIKEISEQYVAITSKIDLIQNELLNDQGTVLKEQKTGGQVSLSGDSYYSMLQLFSEGERGSSRSNYVTYEEFEDLLIMFYGLLDSLESLSNTVSGISAQIPTINSTIQSLVNSCGSLNTDVQKLKSAIEVRSDGTMSLCKSSPLIGQQELTCNGSCWMPAVYSDWDRACSIFRVSRDTKLESVTLYCNDRTRIISPQNVSILTCRKYDYSDNYYMAEYIAASIDTSSFPRITYTFLYPITISADRDHALCVRRSGNNPLYVYVYSGARNSCFYKPWGAPEYWNPPEPPEPPEPRGDSGDNDSDNNDETTDFNRAGTTPYQWFYYLLSQNWEESNYSFQEIWSIFKFSDDVSFNFNSEGLDIEKGKITVEGSEVATSANMAGMITNAFAQTPGLRDAIFPAQYGKVTITLGNLDATIATGLTTDTIINVTPAQVMYPRYWVEIDGSGCGKVKIDTSYPVLNDLTFYYMVIKP